MAEFLVSAVVAVGVGAQQPLHPVHQVGLRSFYHQMKVIPHEAIGVHLPTGLFAGFGKRLQEAAPVNVIQEDNLAPVATIHEACPAVACKLPAKADDKSPQGIGI